MIDTLAILNSKLNQFGWNELLQLHCAVQAVRTHHSTYEIHNSMKLRKLIGIYWHFNNI